MNNNKDFFINDSKISFWVGAGAGIAIFTTIGFIILLVNMLGNGDAKKTEIDAGANEPSPTQAADQPSAPSGQVDIRVGKNDHVRGNPNAQVTIVEFSDFQCPFCGRFHPTLKKVMSEYGDKVRWVYKHFPLDSLHPNARPAAMASECAAEQGKFWEFADKLFDNQQSLSDKYYKQVAGGLGLDTTQFNDCVDNKKYAAKVDGDYQAGLQAGVQGTPASFINGRFVSGAQPYETVKAAIDSLL